MRKRRIARARGNRLSIMRAIRRCDTQPLTRVLKPIATALWHCRRQPGGNSLAGAEFSGRQMEVGRIAAGSSRASRLDPFSLPVRFEAADEAADGRRRVVDLHRERVVVRRSVRGMRMALNLPVAAFRGVAIRLDRQTGRAADRDRRRARARRPGAVAAAVFFEHDATTSSPNGSPGAVYWACRCLSPSATAAFASRSRGLARYASKRRHGAGAGVAPSRAADPDLVAAPRGGNVSAAAIHRGEREIIARNRLRAVWLLRTTQRIQTDYVIAVLSSSTKLAAAIGSTRPRRVARMSLACSSGGSIKRQRDHVARRNERLTRLAELKANAAVHAGECLHGFDRIGNQARIEIERGLGQHLLDQGASGERRVAQRQRIGQAVAQPQVTAGKRVIGNHQRAQRLLDRGDDRHVFLGGG